MTENNIVSFAQAEHAGWFGHWPQAVGNPVVPDLVVWDRAMTRTLMVELKVRKAFRKGQKEAITGRLWRVAFTSDEFAGHLASWTGRGAI